MASETFNLDIQINSQPAEAALKRLQSQFDATKKKADAIGSKASSGLKDYTKTVKAATGVTELFGRAIAVVGFGKIATEIVSTIAGIETLSASLKVVTGSAQGAADALALINKIGLSSAFSVNEIGKAFINLKANGVEPTESLLRTFADTAAITTDRLGALNAISNLFARNVQGGLNLQDLNTLANQGIPVFKILADTLGVTRGAIADLGKTAEGANLILDALKTGLDRQFAGASIQQAKTLAGQFDILRENLQQLAVTAGGGGLESGLKNITTALNEIVVSLKPIAATLGGTLGTALSGLGSTLKFIAENFTLVTIAASATLAVFGRFPTVITAVATAATGLATTFLLFGASTGKLVAGLGRVAVALPIFARDVGIVKAVTIAAGEALGILAGIFAGTAVGAIRAVTASLGILVRGIVAFLGPVGATIAAISLLVTAIGYIKDVTISAGSSTATVGELFSYYWDKVSTSIDNAWESFKNFASSVTDFVVPDWLRNFAGQVADFLTPTEAIKSIAAAREAAAELERENAKFQRQAAGNTEDAARNAAAQKLNSDLLTNRTKTILETVRALNEEAKALSQSRREAEGNNKILEIEAQLREKLTAARSRKEGESDAQFTARIAAEATLDSIERQKILNSVTSKYRAILGETLKDKQFETELIGKSAEEVAKLTAQRELDLLIGVKAVGLEKQRADILKEITRQEKAKVDLVLSNSFTGITREIELLKLSNQEREKAIALDAIAKEAGFRSSAEFQTARPEDFANFNQALGDRNKAQVAANAREQIQSLQEQLDLLKKVDDKERERATTLKEIYKQIDPNGRGANITEAQKEQIKNLEAQIEAQNAFLEISKKIQDQFETLGSAVTKAFLGGKDAVAQLKLELIRLAALQAFKVFAGGISSGSSGSFFSGLISGLGGSRAAGGSTIPGKMYRVGEQGPENVIFGQPAQVIPNQDAQMRISTKTGNLTVQVNPTFQNNGTINSTEDLEGYMAQWGEGVARQTEKFIREQFSPTGLAYNR